jgi:hypothetical protein
LEVRRFLLKRRFNRLVKPSTEPGHYNFLPDVWWISLSVPTPTEKLQRARCPQQLGSPAAVTSSGCGQTIYEDRADYDVGFAYVKSFGQSGADNIKLQYVSTAMREVVAALPSSQGS